MCIVEASNFMKYGRRLNIWPPDLLDIMFVVQLLQAASTLNISHLTCVGRTV